MMRFRLANPRVLIDLHRIPGLDFLEEAQGVLRIGAMCAIARWSEPL
jgi:carbon-monoxide dehydrogenase medium subunit